MAETLRIEFYAPTEDHLDLEATEIILPGSGGVFSVKPGHTALLTTLLPGVIVAHGDEGEKHFAISGGFAEVLSDTVIILADVYEPGDEIDLERAEAARERAEERIRKPQDDTDLARAEYALQRALSRLSAHRGEGY